MTESNLLDDVDETTNRATLWAKLRDAARRVFEAESAAKEAKLEADDKRVGRLQEIEERVRAKWGGRNQDVIKMSVYNTVDEWGQVAEFLSEFEDLLPVALHRINEGAKEANEEEVSA